MNLKVIGIIVAVVLISVIALFMINKDEATTPNATPTPSASASPTATPDDFVSATKVILKTSKGDIRITLYPTEAPKAVQNFVTLGKRGYYDGVVFHRVVKDFMIQTGDPEGTGRGGESIYGQNFELEQSGYKFEKGSLGMASRGGNTLGSQFFIMTEKAYPSLDGGYTNFGKVEDEASQKVVQAIGAT
ncbi:MAG: Cof-like hydrolase, partial [Patescibacteria group bacterium]|nr:Cof-like hydrolase [Patescibacteria group bacterium]